MTIKELMTAVSDDLARFPRGWNSDAKEVFKALGADHFETQQKKVWMLTIRQPGAEVDFAVSVYRTLAKAKAAMEEDIAATLDARRSGIHSDADLERVDPTHAKVGEEIDWEITRETLWA